MQDKLILVLDCGATNVRTIAVNKYGQIVAVSSVTNNTQPDPEYPDYRIWDVSEIWQKFRGTARHVLTEISADQIAAVTVTTFGVDGAPFLANGKILYPVISWQCERTAQVMANINKYIPLNELYRITGIQPFIFNTINKLIWLKENKPEIAASMDYFLFISSIFLYYLSGEMVTDITMAGTSMLTDLNTRTFSEEIAEKIGYSVSIFPRLVEPGEIIGKTTPYAAVQLGIPESIPVVASGHDTQFAIYGSGAEENIPVLSSGTWEILMVRSRNVKIGKELLKSGVTTEFDPVPGRYDIGVQWIASGTLEWIKQMFYSAETDKSDIYDIMIREAEKIAPGSQGIRVDPSFYPGSADSGAGMIKGLNMNSRRGAIYRAALEALACRTKNNLNVLEEAGGFSAKQLLCVGGGSKNRLWNQLRADILDIPVRVVKQKETTVLGSALFALYAIGIYESPDKARETVKYQTEDYYPAGGKRKIYDSLYEDYLRFFEERKT